MPRVRMTSLLAVTLAATLAVAGCGSDDAPEATPDAPPTTTPAATTATARPQPPTPPATTPAPEPTPTATPSKHDRRRKTGVLRPHPRASAGEAHLLAADRLPALTGAWTSRTAAEDPAVGACQKTGLGSIGALESVRRSFSAEGGATATQVVGRFADARSAWRAHEVLVAWRDDCEERLRARVGPLEPLTVRVGTGQSYRAAYKKRAAGFGILRAGAYLTVLEITAAPDRYPDDWDPTRVAVRRIARTF